METILVTGDTYPVRQSLKGLGGIWDAAAKGWRIPTANAVAAQELLRLRSGSAEMRSLRKRGLFQGISGVAPIQYTARMTIPVVEAFSRAGSVVVPLGNPGLGYLIQLGAKMPQGIVAVHLNESPRLGLRLRIEPKYPQEEHDFWAQVDFTPCPECEAPLIWYEAGYVPGYRVCARAPYHHSIAK